MKLSISAFVKVSYVKHIPGHLNSRGEEAPWCICKHETGEVLQSYKTKEDAEEGLRNMHIHKSGETAGIEAIALNANDFNDHKEDWPKIKGFEDWRNSLGNLASGIDSTGEMARQLGLTAKVSVAYLVQNGETYVTGIFYHDAGYGSINKDFSVTSPSVTASNTDFLWFWNETSAQNFIDKAKELGLTGFEEKISRVLNHVPGGNLFAYRVYVVDPTQSSALHKLRDSSTFFTAAPKLVEQSILYLILEADQEDPRYLKIRFNSPKLRKTQEAQKFYKLEVGDWDVDKNFSTRRVRQYLKDLVVPTMKSDVLTDDHELFEKVLRKIRAIVLEAASVYFEVPMAEKKQWKDFIKLDIQKLVDTKVKLEDTETKQEYELSARVSANLIHETFGSFSAEVVLLASASEDEDVVEASRVVADYMQEFRNDEQHLSMDPYADALQVLNVVPVTENDQILQIQKILAEIDSYMAGSSVVFDSFLKKAKEALGALTTDPTNEAAFKSLRLEFENLWKTVEDPAIFQLCEFALAALNHIEADIEHPRLAKKAAEDILKPTLEDQKTFLIGFDDTTQEAITEYLKENGIATEADLTALQSKPVEILLTVNTDISKEDVEKMLSSDGYDLSSSDLISYGPYEVSDYFKQNHLKLKSS